MFELIIYDRIKYSLPPYLAKHLLALESANDKGWLGRQTLIGALDAYVASSSFVADRNVNNKRDQRPKSPFKANDKFNGSKTFSDKEKGNASRPLMKRCFICGSNQHMKSACPRRSQYRPDRNTGREGQGHAQVHTCTAGTAQEWAGSGRLDSDSRLRCVAGSSVVSDQP